MNAIAQARIVVLTVLEREEQAHLDTIAWEGLRKQLVPTVAIALLRAK